MRAFEFLIEYGNRKGVRNKKYRDGNKPPWYEKAVKLKTDNPRMSAIEIGKLVGRTFNTVLFWLTGKPDSSGRIYNDNPPFKPEDFPNSIKGARYHKYRGGGKPDWYEEAVKLKTDNPRMTAIEIGRQVGHSTQMVLFWLTGIPDQKGNIYNDNPPFKPEDFPNIGGKKYFDGAKPWWYEQAIAMRKQGMTWGAISNKISTPEKRVVSGTVQNWLIKGGKSMHGTLFNPDAPFTPRPYNTTKIDTTEIEKLILVDKYTDEQIIKYIQDKKGDKIANQVRAMLPQLRQKLNPGTSVIDKTSTDDTDITFVKENFSD